MLLLSVGQVMLADQLFSKSTSANPFLSDACCYEQYMKKHKSNICHACLVWQGDRAIVL